MIEVINFVLMRSKSHFTLNYRFSLLVCGFWALKVEAEVSGGEDLGADGLLREAWLKILHQPHRFACSHASLSFKGVHMASIYGGQEKLISLPQSGV